MSEGSAKNYRELLIWQRSMKLVGKWYQLTKSFPEDEKFGLTSQLRRAAVSVPANIAEGFGRETTGAFVQFLRTAQGSLKELETHMLIAEEIDIVPKQATAPLLAECDEIGRMLRSFMRSIEKSPTFPSKNLGTRN